MRLLRPPMRFWTFTALICFALALIAWGVAYQTVARDLSQPKIELLKIFIQALFVTLGGGVLMTFLNVRKDEDQKDLAREAAVRELVEEIRTTYRKMKMVKRRLRSRMDPPASAAGARRHPPYIVPSRTFEKAMEDLLAAQIEAEQVRDSVLARDDLLDETQIKRVHAALDYAARYFHDVYQDFEDCLVTAEEGRYRISAGCRGLTDFLGRRAWEVGESSPWATEMEEHFKTLRDETLKIEVRYAAFERIRKLRKRIEGRPRFRIVATECIGLASADLQQAVRRERWRSRVKQAVRGRPVSEATKLRTEA